MRTVAELDERSAPDEYELEFAIKFTGEGNVFVAKVGAEANLKVTLRYARPKQ